MNHGDTEDTEDTEKTPVSLQGHACYTVLHKGNIEIQNQADLLIAELKVSKELGFMTIGYSFDAFEFDNYQIIDE
jgi:hypothetical protein